MVLSKGQEVEAGKNVQPARLGFWALGVVL